MKEIVHGIGSPVTPVIVWSKSKLVQWNYFSPRRTKRDQGINLEHCCSVRNTHCEPVLRSYSPHLESIPNLPFFFHFQLNLSKGREEGVSINPFFNLSDLAFYLLTTSKDHTAEFLQLQHHRGSHSHSALAYNKYERMPQASALTGVTAEPLLQCHCITLEAVHW